MSKARVVVSKVVSKQMSVSEAAAAYGCHVSTSTDGSPDTATMASTAWRRILAIADQTTVTVMDLTTGEILSTHTIDPDRSYWRNQQKSPGRWPRA